MMETTRFPGATAATPSGLWKAAMLAAAAFVLWKAARGARDLLWGAIGLGFAACWAGFWPW